MDILNQIYITGVLTGIVITLIVIVTGSILNLV